MIGFAAQRLMAETDGLWGAGHDERSYARRTHRNGYRGWSKAELSTRDVASMQRLERGVMQRMHAILRVALPLCERHGHTLDRLLFGRKPHPNSVLGRARAGDLDAIRELRATLQPG